MKKFILTTICLLSLSTTLFGEYVAIEELKGLQRNPKADRIENGAHDIFQDVYINDGNIQNIKGRERLNSTAHTDIVVNGMWYYENQAGTTKKILVAESDEIVSYALDGTGRTSLVSGLTNTDWDAVQIGDTEYFTSSNGLYKWTGSGSATLITGVSSPSSLTFSASSTVGGLTSGEDALIQVKNCSLACTGSNGVRYPDSTSSCIACNTSPTATIRACDLNTYTNTSCSSLSTSDWNTSCATSTTYKYVTTFYNSLLGIESQPSASTSVSLSGANTFDSSPSAPYGYYAFSTTCGANLTVYYRENTAIVDANARLTSTQTTLGSSPASPFNGYCIYRTVAQGEDFFKVNCITTGFGGSYTDGLPDTGLSSALDTTIDTIDPPSYKYIEEYKGTIFVAQGDTIKFSRLPTSILTDADKYWLDSDELQITGQITGMIKASDSLIVFTKNSVYQITGFGVTSFRLIPIVQGIGATNDETVELDTNGDVIFFSGTEGVYRISVGQQPVDSLTGNIIDNKNARLTKLSAPAMDNIFIGDDTLIDLDPADYSTSHAYYDKDNNLYFLYIDNQVFIFDAISSVWSYSPATQMIASIYTKTANSQGQGLVVDNLGFFYNNWKSNVRGVITGTVTGNSTSSTSNTMTCSSCSFDTTNDGLKGAWIFIRNENEEYHQIASNTSTSITITDTWQSNPITDDKWFIGYIHPKWRTKQYSFVKVPQESIITNLYLNHNKSESSQILVVRSLEKKSEVASNEFQIDLSQKFIDVINTRMRSPWLQWSFYTDIYNTSDTVDSPVDIVSYTIDAEQRERIE